MWTLQRFICESGTIAAWIGSCGIFESLYSGMDTLYKSTFWSHNNVTLTKLKNPRRAKSTSSDLQGNQIGYFLGFLVREEKKYINHTHRAA